MLKRVLVPLDGSLLARVALDFAVHTIAPECEIVLVTAVQMPEFPVYGAEPLLGLELQYRPTIDTVHESAESYLAQIAEGLRQKGYATQTYAEVGEPAEVIVEIARKLNVDMIVMSTHGRSGISRWLLGSVTNRVLNTAARPVLVVPSHDMSQTQESEIAEANFG